MLSEKKVTETAKIINEKEVAVIKNFRTYFDNFKSIKEYSRESGVGTLSSNLKST